MTLTIRLCTHHPIGDSTARHRTHPGVDLVFEVLRGRLNGHINDEHEIERQQVVVVIQHSVLEIGVRLHHHQLDHKENAFYDARAA